MFVKMVYQLVQVIVYAKLVDKIQINYNVCQFAQNFLIFFFWVLHRWDYRNLKLPVLHVILGDKS